MPVNTLLPHIPKACTENERTTIVVSDAAGRSVLFRQIAGALARRIVYYCKTGDTAQQAQQMGFIKFGSRVDVFLPITAKVKVVQGQIGKRFANHFSRMVSLMLNNL